MDKITLKKTIGENIRKHRIAKDMSIDELSELLGLSPGFIGLIERGQRGATAYTLHKLSQIFQIKVDELFCETSETSIALCESAVDHTKVKREKVSTLLYDLRSKELDFVIEFIKGLKNMLGKNNQLEDDDENYSYDTDNAMEAFDEEE